MYQTEWTEIVETKEYVNTEKRSLVIHKNATRVNEKKAATTNCEQGADPPSL